MPAIDGGASAGWPGALQVDSHVDSHVDTCDLLSAHVSCFDTRERPHEFAPPHLFVVPDLSGGVVVCEPWRRFEGPRSERIRSVDGEALTVGIDGAGNPS